MDFLYQTFTFNVYYNMTKQVFNKIGFDYYKGLKNKLPPIRYVGIDSSNNELVTFAHPKDFTKQLNLFKEEYENIIKQNQIYSIDQTNLTNQTNLTDQINEFTISNKKNEILEIYPSTDQLNNIPNGFIALFLNDEGQNKLQNEFNINDEVCSLNFLQVTNNGIDLTNIKTCGVIDSFIKKFNKKQHLINKYNGLFLVIGEIKTIDIKSGITKSTNKFNIIGGKRNFYELTIDSAIREAKEELGLIENSVMYNFIEQTTKKTKDIVKCQSFYVYCIFYTPKNETEYNFNKNSAINKNIMTEKIIDV